MVRLVIDGVAQQSPGCCHNSIMSVNGLRSSASDPPLEEGTHGFIFISDPQTPNVTHEAKIQWATLDFSNVLASSKICIGARTMAILNDHH